jgi:hypothetical protein
MYLINKVGHILRGNCLLQQVIEGKIKGGIEMTGRRGRRSGKLLDDLKERRRYSHLKEEALDHTMWRARFGRIFEPVVRQTTKLNEMKYGGRDSVGTLRVGRARDRIPVWVRFSLPVPHNLPQNRSHLFPGGKLAGA